MPDNSGNWWDSSPELPDYYAFLPEREQAMGAKDRSLAALTHMGTFGYLPYWRADQEAQSRGESDKGRSTPQYDAQRLALQKFYNETWESAPDTVKVLSVAGLPGGLSPMGAASKALGASERPILTGAGIGAAGAGVWGYNAPQEPASDDWKARLQSSLEAIPYGAAFGAAGGAAQHGANTAQEGIDLVKAAARARARADAANQGDLRVVPFPALPGPDSPAALPPAAPRAPGPSSPEPPAPGPSVPPAPPAPPPPTAPSSGGTFDALDLVAPRPAPSDVVVPARPPRAAPPSPVEPEVPHVPGPDLFAPPIAMPAVETAPEIPLIPPQSVAPWLARPDVQHIPAEWTSGDAWWAQSPIVSEAPPPAAETGPALGSASAPETPAEAAGRPERLPAPVAAPAQEQPATTHAVVPQTPKVPEPVSEADPYALIGGAPAAPAPAEAPVPAPAPAPAPEAAEPPAPLAGQYPHHTLTPQTEKGANPDLYDQLHQSMQTRTPVEFMHEGLPRIGSVHRIGQITTKPGDETRVQMYQTGGKSSHPLPGWRFFNIGPAGGKGKSIQPGSLKLNPEGHAWKTHGDYLNPNTGGLAQQTGIRNVHAEIPHEEAKANLVTTGEQGGVAPAPAPTPETKPEPKKGVIGDFGRGQTVMGNKPVPDRLGNAVKNLLPEEQPTQDFASTVNSLLGTAEKMPISQVYDKGIAAGKHFGSLEDFKRKLADAAKEGNIELERHDIAGGIDKRSETPFGRDVRHYVVNPNPVPAAAPASSAPASPYSAESGHFHAGLSAAREGKPRALPSYFTDPKNKNARDWLRGYDAFGKEQAPRTETPPAPSAPSPFDLIAPAKEEAKKPSPLDLIAPKPAPKPAAAPQEQAAKPSPQREWKPIGKNADGVDLFEDQRGVRSYVSDGIRHVEPVTINPRGGISTNRKIHTEYEVAPAPTAEPNGLIERIPGPEGDGTEALIFKNSDGERFNVVLRDKDAESTVSATIVKDLDQARAKAQEMLYGPAKPKTKPAEAQPAAPTTPRDAFVSAVKEKLAAGERPFRTIVEARKLAKEHGLEFPEGESANKHVDELVERAVVETARSIVDKARAGKEPPADTFAKMVRLYENQPNLSTRTSASVAEQAYSTPAPLAYVASRLSDIGPSTYVLEPTAGNGMLLMEANPRKAVANELNPTRAKSLEEQGFKPTKDDAAEEATFADRSGQMDAVIANPPFGSVRVGGQSKVFHVGDYNTTQIDHAIALNALKAMKADGRAVLIVGGVKADTPQERAEGYGQKTKRRFFHQLLNNYKVSDIFTVSGDLYAKQGAGWPVDVIVIDGKGATDMVPLTKQPPPLLKSWDEVGAKLNDAKTYGEEGASTPSEDSGSGRAPFDEGERRPAGGNAVGGERTPGGRPAELQPKPQRPAEMGGSGHSTEPVNGGRSAAGAEARGEPREGRNIRGSDQQPNNEGGRPVEVEGQEVQVPYEPASQRGVKLDTLLPANLRDATEESLARLQREHGSIDDYVASALGRKPEELGKYFSAEQIDAIGLGISNIQKDEGFIVGDQTGVGKGRVLAAMISYAKSRGLIPLFVTKDPGLYYDMWRDLHDIGWDKQLGRPIDMVMTNANTRVPLDEAALDSMIDRENAIANGEPPPPEQGKFTPSQGLPKTKENMRAILNGEMTPDVVFTTYDQMRTVKGAETDRRRFLRAIAPRSFLIMDESHKAGGSASGGDTWSKASAPPPTSEIFREAVALAPSVMYSSATYAKSPHVMTLYSKTDMSKAVSDPKLLPELIARGGVPLQQVVASMLTKAGQYIRRERSFEGIPYDHKSVPINEDTYEEFTNGLRSVFDFDRSFEKERADLAKKAAADRFGGTARDAGVGEVSASSTAFSSIMHNINRQMVTALKARAIGKEAVAAIKAGEKPFVAMSNTNESFLKQFMDASGLKVGDVADIGFGDVLRRYLERTRRVTLKLGNDETAHYTIPVSDMSLEAQAGYHAALDTLRDLDLGDLPVSPIDAIRHEIQKAGYSVREITGRTYMLDYSGDEPVIVKRPSSEVGEAGKKQTIKMYNDGRLDAVIGNQAAATGLSAHASPKFKDQSRRRMIIGEAEADINTHFQMLGRVNRTGQVVLPAYTHLTADIPAEVRPTAVLMRKMASLNANTTGAAKSRFSADAVDFLNKYGDQVAHDVMSADPETLHKLGYPIDTSGDVAPGSAAKVTGRLTLLTPNEQQALLDRITGDYKSLIEALDAAGENDLEAKHLDLQAKILDTKQLKASTGPSPFQGAVNLEKVSVKAQGRALAPNEVSSRLSEALSSKGGGGNFVQDMPRLEREGKAKQDAFIEQARVKAAEQERKVIGGLKNPDAKKRAEEKAREDFKKWRDLASTAYPGAKVTLRIGGEDIPAIALSFSQKQTAKNLLALSSWEALFALPNSSRTLGVPLSRLKQNAAADDKGVVGIKGGASVSFADLADMFERARKEGREDRYMITGNLLAGLDQTRGSGHIITHTMEDGTTRPAILMNKQFKEKDFFENRAIRFENGEHVLKFLLSSKAGEVKSADDVISIRLDRENWRYVFEVPAAKATGGKYYADRTVRDVFDNWQKRGGKMIGALPRERAAKLIDAMRNVGAVFETKSEQDLAISKAEEKAPSAHEKQADASAVIRPLPPQYARSFDLVTPKSENPLLDAISRNRGIA